MGADRKGPLAAFVVVTIIAAVLLVTSVRSQAAPGIFGRPLPITIVMSPPSATGDLWGSVSRHAGQAVHEGIVLAHKAVQPVVSDDPVADTATDTAGTALGAPTPSVSSVHTKPGAHPLHVTPAPHPGHHSLGHHTQGHHSQGHHPHAAPAPSGEEPGGPPVDDVAGPDHSGDPGDGDHHGHQGDWSHGWDNAYHGNQGRDHAYDGDEDGYGEHDGDHSGEGDSNGDHDGDHNGDHDGDGDHNGDSNGDHNGDGSDGDGSDGDDDGYAAHGRAFGWTGHEHGHDHGHGGHRGHGER